MQSAILPTDQGAGLFHRSPLQVLLLDFATFGAYGFYYTLFNFRLAEIRLGRKPIRWIAFALALPLVNIAVCAFVFSAVGKRVQAAGVTVRLPLTFQVVFMQLVDIGKVAVVPAGPVVVPLLMILFWRSVDSLILANIHRSVAAAEAADVRTAPAPRLSVWEWIIIALGCSCWLLVLAQMLVGR